MSWLLVTLFALDNPFPAIPAEGSAIRLILNIVFSVVAAVSLIFVTLGGFKYVTSRGDPQAVNKAKDTILYAVIGLVVTLLAASIVNFVVVRL